MNNYKIFKNSLGIYEAVKQGWSWPAFFFGIIWTFVKRIWWLGFGLFIISILLQTIVGAAVKDMPIEEAIPIINGIGSVFGIVVCFLLGMYGNSLREKNLISRGYTQVAIITAESPQQAITQFLEGDNSQLLM
ncbi:DUF2628 domain-containing protein [Entomomonas asaccharolytica]|uniref:DUF2628 domain-containing protein n=1 Tax=Entomomonas asaccharolytica TaxID=2785331 RepID=A0A974NFX0_9GAMM|nr:DUF2628 domain-containing protein [Entomomonas asaccharolytica]QQP85823.1 DUF2628 domain-containing protein [Entomomonas asaccharolytica]